MKKTMSLLLMSVVGMVGTYAFAGSGRENTVDRLQKSVDVLHAIMSTPDKGIPEEVLRQRAARLTAGALLHLFRSAAGVGDCRSALKVWISSCLS
jgi:hypothetical protein